MDRQQKYKPQSANPVFADGRTHQRPPEGTIAVGAWREDEGYSTGKLGAMYVGRNPLLDAAKHAELRATLELGQTRFNTYCSPCHGGAGNGMGIVAKKVPTWSAQNLHEARIVQYPDGEIFDVITNGRRSMKGYRTQISERDRWAIVAYVRVLQRKDLGLPPVGPAMASAAAPKAAPAVPAAK
jgi:mono/diheme cytochrome c family protein